MLICRRLGSQVDFTILSFWVLGGRIFIFWSDLSLNWDFYCAGSWWCILKLNFFEVETSEEGGFSQDRVRYRDKCLDFSVFRGRFCMKWRNTGPIPQHFGHPQNSPLRTRRCVAKNIAKSETSGDSSQPRKPPSPGRGAPQDQLRLSEFGQSKMEPSSRHTEVFVSPSVLSGERRSKRRVFWQVRDGVEATRGKYSWWRGVQNKFLFCTFPLPGCVRLL